MKENNFLKNIKASLDQPPSQPYDENDWTLLSEMLDERKKKKRIGLWLWVGLLIALGMASSAAFFISQKSDSTTAKTTLSIVASDATSTAGEEQEQVTQLSGDINFKKEIAEKRSPNKTITNQAINLNFSTAKNSFYKNSSPSDLSKPTFLKKEIPQNLTSDSYRIKENNNLPASMSYEEGEMAVEQQVAFRPIQSSPLLFERPIALVFSKQKNRRIELYKLEDEPSEGTAGHLKIDSFPNKITYAKRKMIGLYVSRPFLKSDANYGTPLMIGARGRYFLNPRWSLQADLFHIRFKQEDAIDFALSPTPTYTLESRTDETRWYLYQFGTSYWIGNNPKWHPYVGASLGGLISAVYIDKRTYRNTITNELVDARTSYSDSPTRFVLPIFINYRAGLLYRFKNPRFNCQLELNYNQMLLRNSESPFLPSLTAGVFYHF